MSTDNRRKGRNRKITPVGLTKAENAKATPVKIETGKFILFFLKFHIVSISHVVVRQDVRLKSIK